MGTLATSVNVKNPQTSNHSKSTLIPMALIVVFPTRTDNPRRPRNEYPNLPVFQPRPQGLLRTWRVKNEKTLVKAVLNSVVIGLYI